MYDNDKRIVLTLDAGGTGFVFSAMQGYREIVRPVKVASVTNDLDLCLDTLASGFRTVRDMLPAPPEAISFATASWSATMPPVIDAQRVPPSA